MSQYGSEDRAYTGGDLGDDLSATPPSPGIDIGGPGVIPVPTAGVVTGGIAAFPGDPMQFDAWNYRADVGDNRSDLAGFQVEATDGKIGKVDKSSHDTDHGYLVVDTGPWIFGRKVVVPAGTVNHIDRDAGVVYLDRTKDQVKASPEGAPEATLDESGRDHLREYYHNTYKSQIR